MDPGVLCHIEGMPYSLRRAYPEDDRPDDYVIRHDGADVGRLYKHDTPLGERWRWSIYIGTGALKRAVAGIPLHGNCETLDEAKAAFRHSYERLLRDER